MNKWRWSPTLLILSSVACADPDSGGEDPMAPSDPTTRIAAVHVQPRGVHLEGVGSTVELTATAVTEDGSPIQAELRWTSLNPRIAVIEPSSGIATSVSSGQATISATADGVTGYALATVSVESGAPPVEWTTVKAFEPTLLHIWGTRDGSLYAVSQVGPLRRAPDGTWQPLANVPGGCCSHVWASGDTAYFTGTGGVYTYSSGAWQHMRGFGWRASAIWGSGPDDLHVGGDGGQLAHWDGSAWRELESPTSLRIRGGSSSDPDDSHAIGPSDMILYFDGDSWRARPSPVSRLLLDIWAVAPDQVHAVGESGTLLHFDGIAWETKSSPEVIDVWGVWGTAADSVYAIGFGRLLSFDGEAWSSLDMVDGWEEVLPQAFGGNGDMWGRSTEEVWATGWGSALLRGESGSWRIESGGHSGRLQAIWGVSADTVFAGGYQSAHFRIVGDSWSVTPGSYRPVNGLWGLSGSQVWAAGPGVSAFDGIRWESSLTQGAYGGIWGSAPDDIWAVGYLGSFALGYETLVQRYDGSSWHTEPVSGGGRLRDVWGSAEDDVWAVGPNGVLYHFDGSTWSQTGSPQGVGNLRAVWGSSSDDVFAAGESSGLGGVIARFDGRDWSVMEVGSDVPIVLDLAGTSGSDVFATTGGSELLYFDGTTWQSIDLAEGRYTGVWATQPGYVYLAGDGGAVVRSAR